MITVRVGEMRKAPTMKSQSMKKLIKLSSFSIHESPKAEQFNCSLFAC